MAFAAGGQRHAAGGGIVLPGGKDFHGFHSGEHPVDRLEEQGGIMDIDDLAQRVPGGMIFPFRFRQGVPDFIPVSLGSGEAVVAVAHGQQQRIFSFGVQQGIQGGIHMAQGFGALHGPAAQVAAVHHQVEIIELPQGAFPRAQGLQHRAFRVVDQDHDMRELDRGAAADDQPRRQAGRDGLLRRPDQRQGALLKGILLQVHRADQAQAVSAGNGAFAQHKAVFNSGDEEAFRQVIRHGGMDGGNTFFAVLQIIFREDQPQGGRGIPRRLICLLPVFRFRGVLVAGDAGPGFRFYGRRRQQDFRRADSDSFKSHQSFTPSGCLPPNDMPGGGLFQPKYKKCARTGNPICLPDSCPPGPEE